jgi:flagellar basal body rod protein FlgB
MKLYDLIINRLQKDIDPLLVRRGMMNVNIANAGTPGSRPADLKFQNFLLATQARLLGGPTQETRKAPVTAFPTVSPKRSTNAVNPDPTTPSYSGSGGTAVAAKPKRHSEIVIRGYDRNTPEVRSKAQTAVKEQNGDTRLTRVNPRKEMLLKRSAGAGSGNPDTGLTRLSNPNRIGAGWDQAQTEYESLFANPGTTTGMGQYLKPTAGAEMADLAALAIGNKELRNYLGETYGLGKKGPSGWYMPYAALQDSTVTQPWEDTVPPDTGNIA